MDPYTGEIRLFAGNYVPEDWLACNGQALSINNYQTLYSLIGTTYGGSGGTFNVPNLQVALAVGQSPTTPPNMAYSYPLGVAGGAYQVTLSPANLPSHTHALNATTTAATTNTPGNTVLFAPGPSGFVNYVDTGGSPTLVDLAAATIGSAGGNQPHPNMMPTLVITYIICANGLYPSFN
jgi:microcystin-dependent protein